MIRDGLDGGQQDLIQLQGRVDDAVDPVQRADGVVEQTFAFGGRGVDGNDGVVTAYERLNCGRLQLDELIDDRLVTRWRSVAQHRGAQRAHAFERGGEQAREGAAALGHGGADALDVPEECAVGAQLEEESAGVQHGDVQPGVGLIRQPAGELPALFSSVSNLGHASALPSAAVRSRRPCAKSLGRRAST